MAAIEPVPLSAVVVGLDSVEFAEILGWPFEDRFVGRLLREDIPLRITVGDCRLWSYRDPAGQLVGFGSIDIGTDYSEYVDGRSHPYIPLLAVNPTIQSRGFGTAIVRHLVRTAGLMVRGGYLAPIVFLDVYETSTKAIALYRKCGFLNVSDTPDIDPMEGGKRYFIMTRRVGPSLG